MVLQGENIVRGGSSTLSNRFVFGNEQGVSMEERLRTLERDVALNKEKINENNYLSNR